MELLEESAQTALLQRIAELAPTASSDKNGALVLHLAEAYAWLVSPNQPHGGSGGD